MKRMDKRLRRRWKFRYTRITARKDRWYKARIRAFQEALKKERDAPVPKEVLQVYEDGSDVSVLSTGTQDDSEDISDGSESDSVQTWPMRRNKVNCSKWIYRTGRSRRKRASSMDDSVSTASTLSSDSSKRGRDLADASGLYRIYSTKERISKDAEQTVDNLSTRIISLAQRHLESRVREISAHNQTRWKHGHQDTNRRLDRTLRSRTNDIDWTRDKDLVLVHHQACRKYLQLERARTAIQRTLDQVRNSKSVYPHWKQYWDRKDRDEVHQDILRNLNALGQCKPRYSMGIDLDMYRTGRNGYGGDIDTVFHVQADMDLVDAVPDDLKQAWQDMDRRMAKAGIAIDTGKFENLDAMFEEDGAPSRGRNLAYLAARVLAPGSFVWIVVRQSM